MPHSAHNFLKARSAAVRRAHPAVRGAVIAFVILAAVVGVTVLFVAPFWYVGERVYARAERGRQELDAAQNLASSLQFNEASGQVAAAEQDFTAAREELSSLRLLAGVPFIGPHVIAGDRLLASGISASHAVGDVLGIADSMTSALASAQGLTGALTGSLPDAARLFKDLSPEQKRKVLAAFADGVPAMRDAQEKIDAAIAAFDAIPQDQIAAPLVESLRPMRPKLTAIREALALLLPVAEKAPSVLGYPDARHYLFFFQNDTELRPTGGFLGVYGLATVKDANLADIVTDDVYALDGPADAGPRPVPPAPIQKYIGVTKWFLRDANWSPDFTVSSRQMAQFFAQEYAVAKRTEAPPIDGLVTIDTEVARDVLRITGPITVQGKTFDADNVVDELEFAVEKGFVQQGVALQARKGIVGELVKQVIGNLESMPIDKLLGALDVLKRNLAEKHVLIAMRDPDIESAILDKDWGGKFKPVRDDFISVIDANLGSLKTDPSVRRSVAYSITMQKDGSRVGTVAITYAHQGRFDWKTTRYRTYARVYVPSGSRFLSVSGAMENDKIKDPGHHAGTVDVVDELQRVSFGAFISIEPGDTKTLSFSFALAPSVEKAINSGTYRLDVEKQPGTVAHGLTLDLDFGKKVTSADPQEDRKYWGDTHYQMETDLRIDRAFTIGF